MIQGRRGARKQNLLCQVLHKVLWMESGMLLGFVSLMNLMFVYLL